MERGVDDKSADYIEPEGGRRVELVLRPTTGGQGMAAGAPPSVALRTIGIKVELSI